VRFPAAWLWRSQPLGEIWQDATGIEQYDEFDLGSRVPPRQPSDSEKNAANVTDGQGIAEQDLGERPKDPARLGRIKESPMEPVWFFLRRNQVAPACASVRILPITINSSNSATNRLCEGDDTHS
jgi:hypothetical protein